MRLWKNGGSWRPGLPGKFPLKNGNIFYSVYIYIYIYIDILESTAKEMGWDRL